MSDFGLFRTFCRELLARKTQARGRPPTNALTGGQIGEALAGGGATDGRFASGYLFHTANISQTIAGAKNCMDLGAAPGCQLLQLAIVNPEITFFGVDHNDQLLARGAKNTQSLNIGNVTWRCDDICTLESFAPDSMDAVISTMTLHDLPDLVAVENCLRAIARVLKPDGAIYLEDYGRLKSAKSIRYFNAVNTAVAGDAFAELNAYSMHAAFDIKELAHLFNQYLPMATLHSTFLIPFLNVLKTEARELPSNKVAQLLSLQNGLGPEKNADLDDLVKFFKLGGWKTDLFARTAV